MARNNRDDTIISTFAKHSINVNGLIIPGRLIEATLARHARNLVVYNDDEVYRVSLPGSATAVRYQGREILLTTQHQLKGIDRSRVALLVDSSGNIITSGGFRAYQPHPETDAYDLVAFDFEGPCKERPEIAKWFFEFNQPPPDVPSNQIMAILLCGYPTSEQAYDVQESNHIGVVCRHIVCEPDSQPSDPAVLLVRAVSPLQVNPDGMSGGAAFVIQMQHGEMHAYFAGVVVRGGKEFFHILKAGYVFAFLKSVFPKKHEWLNKNIYPPSYPPKT